jgi:hypothetical protein
VAFLHIEAEDRKKQEEEARRVHGDRS